MRVLSIMTESNLAPPGDEEKRMTLSVRPNDNHRPSEEVDDIVMPLLERLVRDRIITVANPFAHPRCKLTLPSGQSIRGTQMDENAKRRCSRFAASGGVYAEAYCFVVIGNEEDELPTKVISPNQAYALAREIGNIETTLGITRGSWTDQWVLVDIKDIVEPIGILELDDYVY
ncbi:unnamed protein product [Tilletia caries]|nr:unnamed protein product [Tilletia caries]